MIEATTGPLIPLSLKALLKAFRRARGEKLGLALIFDLISISLFDLNDGLGVLALGDTLVHSDAVFGGELAATCAKERLALALVVEAVAVAVGVVGLA